MDEVRQVLCNIFERYVRQNSRIVKVDHTVDHPLSSLPFKMAHERTLGHRNSKKGNRYTRQNVIVKYQQLSEHEDPSWIDCSNDEICIYVNPQWEDNPNPHRKNGE